MRGILESLLACTTASADRASFHLLIPGVLYKNWVRADLHFVGSNLYLFSASLDFLFVRSPSCHRPYRHPCRQRRWFRSFFAVSFCVSVDALQADRESSSAHDIKRASVFFFIFLYSPIFIFFFISRTLLNTFIIIFRIFIVNILWENHVT